MTLSIDTDYDVVDNTETVTYYVKTAEGVYASGVSVTNVLRRVREKTFEDLHSKDMGKQVLVFHLWTDNLSGIVPKINDRLQLSDSTYWTVKDVSIESLSTRFKVMTTAEIV